MGRTVSGRVEAADEAQAARLIRGKDLILLSLSVPHSTELTAFFKKFRNKVKEEDIATFTRQLSTMINAGLPITDALSILKNQATGRMQELVSQILADVQEGQSLSSAIGKYPDAFSPTYVALLKAGEAGGVLDNILARLSDNMENRPNLRAR